MRTFLTFILDAALSLLVNIAELLLMLSKENNIHSASTASNSHTVSVIRFFLALIELHYTHRHNKTDYHRLCRKKTRDEAREFLQRHRRNEGVKKEGKDKNREVGFFSY